MASVQSWCTTVSHSVLKVFPLSQICSGELFFHHTNLFWRDQSGSSPHDP